MQSKLQRIALYLSAFILINLININYKVVCSSESIQNTIKIGFAGPLTGPQAIYGQSMYRGAQLAIEKFNEKKALIDGKVIEITLLVEDDQADPRLGVQIAQKMIDRQVKGVIGHFNSGVAIPASRLYSKASIPQFSMATAPEYTEQGFATTFRIIPSLLIQTKALGEYVLTNFRRKNSEFNINTAISTNSNINENTNSSVAINIALIDDRTAYGQAATAAFERVVTTANHVKIIKREFTSDKSYDFKAILTNIKIEKPDAIFYGGMSAQAAPLVRQMRDLSINAVFLGSEAFLTDDFLKIAGKAAEGSIISVAGQLPVDMQVGSFNHLYKKRFGQIASNIYASATFDAVTMMLTAAMQAKSFEPKKYLPHLFKIEIDGATNKKLSYNKNGDLHNNVISIYKVVDGHWQLITLKVINDKT